MKVSAVVLLLYGHFLFDWILQPRKMAEQKSRSLKWLGFHVSIQFIWFALYLHFIVGTAYVVFWSAVNAGSHALIDWFIWRWYASFKRHTLTASEIERFERNNEYARDYWFYTFLAVDQFLHLSILTLIAGYSV